MRGDTSDTTPPGALIVPLPVLEAIHQLWEQLADYQPAHMDGALDFLMKDLCGLFNAQHARWIAMARAPDARPDDPQRGWVAQATRQFNYTGVDSAPSQNVVKPKLSEPDPSIACQSQMAGSFRAYRLADLADSWRESESYPREYLAGGTANGVLVVYPVGPHCESYFLLSREPGQPPFSEGERDLIACALRAIKWFHRWLVLSYGLVNTKAPLTESERRVLSQLLTSRTEKEVAAKLMLSVHTTREHISNIYRKFEVSNRSGLLTLWFGEALGADRF